MKDLIKKVLLEYFNLEILTEGVATATVPNNVNNEIDSYLSKINMGQKGFTGFFIDNYNNKIKTKLFLLDDTKHFRQRLFRLSEPEYKVGGDLYDSRIVNPETLEGYKLIVDNINYISELIDSGIIKPERTYVNFYTKTSIPYSVNVVFSKRKMGSKHIEIKLITQIKGVRFNKKFTSIDPTISIGLPGKKSAFDDIASRLVERLKIKLGLIK